MRELFFLVMLLLVLKLFFPLVAEKSEQLLLVVLDATSEAMEAVSDGTLPPAD